MTCEPWHERLGPYVDAELPEEQVAELEAHLRACPACAAEALGRLQMKRMIQSAGRRFTPAAEFQLKLTQAVAKQTQRRARIWPWAVQVATAAAIVVLAVVLAATWSRLSQRQQALGELADLHVATLASANPVDVLSSDKHTVKPWFEGKLPFTFNLPDLQNSPFMLVGGRVTYFEQNPGAQLLFQLRKHQISVFIFQDSAGLARFSTTPSAAHKLNFHIETWAEGGLRYFVVGDPDLADIRSLSELLRAAARF